MTFNNAVPEPNPLPPVQGGLASLLDGFNVFASILPFGGPEFGIFANLTKLATASIKLGLDFNSTLPREVADQLKSPVTNPVGTGLAVINWTCSRTKSIAVPNPYSCGTLNTATRRRLVSPGR